MEKKRITAEVNAFNPNEVELNYAITLAQALPEASKMDWIVEKAVESGVAEIQPLTTQRCVTRLSDERAQKRHAHWQGIVESASEQCGRNQLTHLHSLLNFTTWINQPPSHQRIILSPSSEVSLSNWARQHPAQAVTLMIGPEGGFTDAEQLLAIKQGAICLSIGPRVMRTETAGLCAVTVLNAHWDIAPLKKGSEIN
ncbi:MAG: rRNA methyltransferase [Solimicrobium sp.]|nr:rRNA methyltransferase [Solimicrobium sp.]